MSDNGRVRFIRKNGRVIPIRDKRGKPRATRNYKQKVGDTTALVGSAGTAAGALGYWGKAKGAGKFAVLSGAVAALGFAMKNSGNRQRARETRALRAGRK